MGLSLKMFFALYCTLLDVMENPGLCLNLCVNIFVEEGLALLELRSAFEKFPFNHCLDIIIYLVLAFLAFGVQCLTMKDASLQTHAENIQIVSLAHMLDIL